MKIIELINISKNFGSQDIIKDLTIQMDSEKRYGLIGANGCGKTTLLKIITGEEETSSGKVITTPGVKIGYVPQQVFFHQDDTLFEAITKEYRPLFDVLGKAEEELATVKPEDSGNAMRRYQHARDAYDAAECDHLALRAESILDALGLGKKLEQKVGTLSGGEQSVLGLAAALLNKPDLLILDEPGNHLDYQGLAWLEEFLPSFQGALLIVSHNRYLLDRVCSQILEMEKGTINEYAGNYSAYRLTKLRNLVAQQADYKANQRRLTQLEELVKRFEQFARNTADPAWGKRLRARRTQLAKERENSVDKPELNTRKIGLSLTSEGNRGNIALRVEGYDKAFGSLSLFEDTGFEIYGGDKIALVGLNGCGKSTLLKDILEMGDWENPVLKVGPSYRIGYLAQKQEVFDPDQTIEEEIRSLGPLTRDNAYSIVAPFLFTYQDMDKKIGMLSGGELNRLQLSRLSYLKANFLLLDEPTNHLDIGAREAVEEALQDFDGTLLVVSHDRYFLDKIVHRVVEVQNRKLSAFEGNFSEFWAARRFEKASSSGKVSKRLSERKKQDRTTVQSSSGMGRSSGDSPRNIECRITEAESQKKQLELEITKAFEQGDHKRGRNISRKLEKIVKLLNDLYRKWEEAEG
jgi:ATP-binding cassette subfamily F protein 3